jgi:hypothetical protein
MYNRKKAVGVNVFGTKSLEPSFSWLFSVAVVVVVVAVVVVVTVVVVVVVIVVVVAASVPGPCTIKPLTIVTYGFS